MALTDELGRAASSKSMERLLEELSEMDQKAETRGVDAPSSELIGLHTILASRLGVHFRDAAVAIEEARRPKSMEAGWDEETDQYRELWSD